MKILYCPPNPTTINFNTHIVYITDGIGNESTTFMEL